MVNGFFYSLRDWGKLSNGKMCFNFNWDVEEIKWGLLFI